MRTANERGALLLECLVALFLYAVLLSGPLVAARLQSREIVRIEMRRRELERRQVVRAAASRLTPDEQAAGATCRERRCTIDGAQSGSSWEREFYQWP